MSNELKNPFAATNQELQARKEKLIQLSTQFITWLLVIPVVAIIIFLVYNPTGSLCGVCDGKPESPYDRWRYLAPLIGTFFLVLVSLLIAAPIGILAGVYLNEFARDNWLTSIHNLAVVNLAGVPSIGMVCLAWGAFVYFLGMDRCSLAASCTVAVMTLPVIITSTKEALASVPMSFRWHAGTWSD